MDVWKKLSENSGGEDTDLKVENFIVIHDHVDRPEELLSVGLGVHLQIYVSTGFQIKNWSKPSQ